METLMTSVAVRGAVFGACKDYQSRLVYCLSVLSTAGSTSMTACSASQRHSISTPFRPTTPFFWYSNAPCGRLSGAAAGVAWDGGRGLALKSVVTCSPFFPVTLLLLRGAGARQTISVGSRIQGARVLAGREALPEGAFEVRDAALGLQLGGPLSSCRSHVTHVRDRILAAGLDVWNGRGRRRWVAAHGGCVAYSHIR